MTVYQNREREENTPLFYRFITCLKDQIIHRQQRRPTSSLPILQIDREKLQRNDNLIFWLGHSSLLLKLDKRLILIDPVFSKNAAPIGTTMKRFENEIPLAIENIGEIDAVLLSHNHYDHLDKKTIKAIHSKVDMFLVPAGLKRQLLRWGVQEEKIKECSWNQLIRWNQIEFTCLTARHNSGRGVWDTNKTLWCSWLIKSKSYSIYFSGDSGYGKHFAEIGAVFKNIDLAILECGQYDKRWKNIHMFPKEVVQAAKDLNAVLTLPVHWGMFSLAFHAWDEPIRSVVNEAKKQKISLTTPKIGEPIPLGGEAPESKWWEEL